MCGGLRRWAEEQPGKAKDQQRLESPGWIEQEALAGWNTAQTAGIPEWMHELVFLKLCRLVRGFLERAAGVRGWKQEKKEGQLSTAGGTEKKTAGEHKNTGGPKLWYHGNALTPLLLQIHTSGNQTKNMQRLTSTENNQELIELSRQRPPRSWTSGQTCCPFKLLKLWRTFTLKFYFNNVDNRCAAVTAERRMNQIPKSSVDKVGFST